MSREQRETVIVNGYTYQRVAGVWYYSDIQCDGQAFLDALFEARTQLAAAERNVAIWEEAADDAMKGHAAEIRKRGELQKQLAAAEQERDALKAMAGVAEAGDGLLAVATEMRRLHERAEALRTRAERAEAKGQRLSEIIAWALGERGEFPERPEKVEGKPHPLFWWRTEMRERYHSTRDGQEA